MPPVVFTILAALQAGIQAFPQVASFVTQAKQWFTNMFTEGVITKEQQDALHAHVDAVSEAAQAGKLPPSFYVEPDPQS